MILTLLTLKIIQILFNRPTYNNNVTLLAEHQFQLKSHNLTDLADIK